MSRKFDRPNFISPEIETNLIGKAPHVASLDIPENLKGEKYRGAVIKQINDDPTVIVGKFGGSFGDYRDYNEAYDLIFVESNLERQLGHKPALEELTAYLANDPQNSWLLSSIEKRIKGKNLIDKVKYLKKLFEPEGIAKTLKNRYQFIRNFFADTMPDFVVETQFVLGFKDDKSPTKVYGVQTKISGLDLSALICRLNMLGVVVDTTGTELITAIKEKYTPEQITKIVQQLISLRAKIKKLIRDKNKVLDVFGPGNIFISDEANLQLTDTDELQNAHERFVGENDGKQIEQETGSFVAMKEVLEALSNVIKALQAS